MGHELEEAGCALKQNRPDKRHILSQDRECEDCDIYIISFSYILLIAFPRHVLVLAKRKVADIKATRREKPPQKIYYYYTLPAKGSIPHRTGTLPCILGQHD